MRVKQMIESNIRVKEAPVARRSFSQIHQEDVRAKPPTKNHTFAKRQYIKQKGPSREHPRRPEKVYTPVNTSYMKIYIALRDHNLL